MNRLYLHVGLTKTGTTYLQQLWRANVDALQAQDVWYAHRPGTPAAVRLAVWDLAGRRPRGAPDARIPGQWAALTEEVARRSHQTVLVSEEYLAARSPRLARKAVAGFPRHEVHVVVTVRDIGRSLVAHWEEEVKSGADLSWSDLVDAVCDPDRAHRQPALNFWRQRDLAAVLRTWAGAAGPDRVHVVTVPPAGAPPTLLAERVAGLVGYDPGRLVAPEAPANASLGVAMIESLRRFNHGHRLDQRRYDFVVKRRLLGRLPAAPAEERPTLPERHLAWARERAERELALVRAAGVDVVGDLDDLVPVPAPAGRAPDDASTEEVLAATLVLATELAGLYGALWWRRGRQDAAQAAGSTPRVRLRSGLRASGYRLQRRLVDLAGRNRPAAAALRWYLRRRDRSG